MSLNKKAQEYLDKCRVIGNTEVKDGIIVSSNPSSEFKVSVFTVKGNDVTEEVIEEFTLFDFFDKDDSKMILNFKKTMSDIVGRKKYYLEQPIYDFLVNKDVEPEEMDDYDECFELETAEERAAREAEEEEKAEHQFERFLRAQEEM